MPTFHKIITSVSKISVLLPQIICPDTSTTVPLDRPVGRRSVAIVQRRARAGVDPSRQQRQPLTQLPLKRSSHEARVHLPRRIDGRGARLFSLKKRVRPRSLWASLTVARHVNKEQTGKQARLLRRARAQGRGQDCLPCLA
jgi:hypothetical protein